MNRAKWTAALLASALLALPATSVAHADDVDDCNRVGVKAYKLTIQTDRKTYSLDDVAQVTIRVTRKDGGQPVSGVEVYTAIRTGNRWAMGYTLSDVDGRARMAVPLKRLRPGSADVWGYAEFTFVDTVCAAVYEYGLKKKKDAVTIRR